MVRTGDLTRQFTAMASTVMVRVIEPTADAEAAVDHVHEIFREIETVCTRFDPSSELMRANAAPDTWAEVSETLCDVVQLAGDAHASTGGAFDPRVLRVLTDLGYDRSLNFSGGDVTTSGATVRRPALGPWEPRVDPANSRVLLAEAIDLGGIGKGYAVRRGIEALAGVGSSALVEAGGDLATYGAGPERGPDDLRAWRAAVEDPRGGDRPIAILDVSDAAVATSSIRLRRWHANGTAVHHLIDPRTGSPSASDLLSVTVIASDPAWAEVWTKAAFLEGSTAIAALIDRHDLAAYWVDQEGRTSASASMRERILWEAPK